MANEGERNPKKSAVGGVVDQYLYTAEEYERLRDELIKVYDTPRDHAKTRDEQFDLVRLEFTERRFERATAKQREADDMKRKIQEKQKAIKAAAAAAAAVAAAKEEAKKKQKKRRVYSSSSSSSSAKSQHEMYTVFRDLNKKPDKPKPKQEDWIPQKRTTVEQDSWSSTESSPQPVIVGVKPVSLKKPSVPASTPTLPVTENEEVKQKERSKFGLKTLRASKPPALTEADSQADLDRERKRLANLAKLQGRKDARFSQGQNRFSFDVDVAGPFYYEVKTGVHTRTVGTQSVMMVDVELSEQGGGVKKKSKEGGGQTEFVVEEGGEKRQSSGESEVKEKSKSKSNSLEGERKEDEGEGPSSQKEEEKGGRRSTTGSSGGKKRSVESSGRGGGEETSINEQSGGDEGEESVERGGGSLSRKNTEGSGGVVSRRNTQGSSGGKRGSTDARTSRGSAGRQTEMRIEAPGGGGTEEDESTVAGGDATSISMPSESTGQEEMSTTAQDEEGEEEEEEEDNLKGKQLERKESKRRDAYTHARPVGYRNLNLTEQLAFVSFEAETQVNSFDLEREEAKRRGINLPKDNILWPLASEFDMERATIKIEDYIKRCWSLEPKWMFVVHPLHVSSDCFRKKYIFEVKFSVPTPKTPVPPATASVFFIFEIPVYAQRDETVKVSYILEGTRYTHYPGKIPFQDDWLKGIISDKARIQKAINF